MATTYTAIATTTLGSAQSSVTFSSISGSYTDLVLIINATNTGGLADMFLRVNADTGTNYSYTILWADGSSAGSNKYSTTANMRLGFYGIPGSNVGQVSITSINNYSNSTTYKSFLTRSNNADTGGGTDAIVGLWRNTAAITTLELRASTNNFGIGSTFTLYGIKAA